MSISRFVKRLLLILLLAATIILPAVRQAPAQGGTPRFLVITFAVNDRGHIDIDGNGFYVILFNNNGNPIEVTNPDTYTDFIRFDGFNFEWFHRRDNIPPPGYTWIAAGNLNRLAHISSDEREFKILLDLENPNMQFLRYITNNRFTIHGMTCTLEGSSILGKVLDFEGIGPGLDQNDLNTIQVNRFTGALQPLPPFYPSDPLNDITKHEGLGEGFPYDNFDIRIFEISVQDDLPLSP
ncbi:MAG: hypothetical protein M1269_13150 [Chloroflexi bacterium]|nr:hypothetical protein [Chloroflexota bacterium]